MAELQRSDINPVSNHPRFRCTDVSLRDNELFPRQGLLVNPEFNQTTIGKLIVFFEDVEEGFEISELNKQGVITEYGASQFTIQHITNILRAKHS